jgi:hypothetical protein
MDIEGVHSQTGRRRATRIWRASGVIREAERAVAERAEVYWAVED